MPQLVHGGPGRAGGGEEMGGIRGVLHHMQRTAIQGDPDTLAAITGRWVTGAERHETDVHPFRKHLEELRPGDTLVAGPRVVTQEDVEHFAEFTGDTFYAHMDAEAAAANPLFGERVAHGYLIVSFAAGLFVDPAPGPVLANFGVDNLRFLTPGQVRRRADRHADLQADHPARLGRLRRGALGRRRHAPGRRVGRPLRRPHPGREEGLDDDPRERCATTSTTATRRLGDAPPADTLDPAERMSVDELRALQLERLQWTLRHAYANVPHYTRARSTRAGVHPDDCRELVDIAKFPTTSKADLRENYPFGMFAVPQDQVRRVHASSGTTGKPTVVGYTAQDIDIWAGLVARSHPRRGRAARATRSTTPTGTACSPAVSARTTASRSSGATAIPVSGGMTPRQVQLIVDFGPRSSC